MEPIKPKKCSGGGDKNSKEGGWIYYLNSAYNITYTNNCPKRTGRGAGGCVWKDTSERFYGGRGEEGEGKKYLLQLRSM